MSLQAAPSERRQRLAWRPAGGRDRRRYVFIFIGVLVLLRGLLLLGGAARAQAQQREPAEKPNVVFIYADDMGWKDVGFMGSPYFQTPHLDRLARQGMTFTAAYANAPNCAPSRAALLTGQYAPRTGVYTVNSPARGPARLRKLIPIPNKRTLPREAVTVADVLGEAGYATASMGKWHLGDPPERGPKAQGFDVNVGGYGIGNPNPFGAYFAPWENPYLEDDVAPGTYLTNHLTDRALAFVERHQSRPFFLYLPFYNVHSPWQAPDSLVQKYQEQGKGAKVKPAYGAMIEALDRNVGRLLAKLDALGLRENTIVVFTSDNGGHAAATSMKPLRGSKGTLYEGGIRVPLVVRWPGVTAPGSTSDTPVVGTDVFPTLLEMTGTSVPAGKLLDGRSFVPLLRGRSDALVERALYWHFPAYLQSYTEAQGAWRTTPAGAIRKGAWKLIQFFETGRVELYNLEQDLAESRNRASERPQKAAQMLRLLKRWRRRTGAPVPATPNPAYDPESDDLESDGPSPNP